MTRVFTKVYEDSAACRTAVANQQWLGTLGLDLPPLLAERPYELDLSLIHGRHTGPRDLRLVAAYLGRAHARAYHAELRGARLDVPYFTRSGHHIPNFVRPRRGAVEARLRAGLVPEPAFGTAEVARLFEATAGEPAAFYKDTNPRNVLITAKGAVMVDFDDLTLAPFGYDLAKLIVTLAMTHGRLPDIRGALTAYNAAVVDITTVAWDALMAWAEIHHILTSPYLGRGGYQHGWNELRQKDQR
jgi:hypothetical protein